MSYRPKSPGWFFYTALAEIAVHFHYRLKHSCLFFNLLLPDLRGHGASINMVKPECGKYSFKLIAEDVFALMESLNIERAHFMGGSFGGNTNT